MGNFKQITNDLLNWYGDHDLKYFFKLSPNATKIQIRLEMPLKSIPTERNHIWNFNNAHYELEVINNICLVRGYSIAK